MFPDMATYPGRRLATAMQWICFLIESCQIRLQTTPQMAEWQNNRVAQSSVLPSGRLRIDQAVANVWRDLDYKIAWLLCQTG